MRNLKVRLLAISVLAVLLLVVGLLVVFLIRADREITNRFEGKRWRLPSKIYSDTLSLYPGISLEKAHLFDRLRRLGYQPAKRASLRKGEYRQGTNSLEIYLHDFVYPEVKFKGFPLRIELSGGVITRLVNREHAAKELPSVELEPEVITGIYEGVWEERKLVRLRDVPRAMVDAVIAAEDQRFYGHSGVDPKAVGRAFLANLKARGVVEGGSTLTQQLVKNFFLTPKRTLWRKVQETLMSLLVEFRYSKDQILEAYLNEVYFGQKGSQGIFGVGQAAEFYFGKPAKDLTLPEAALLAGLIRAPNLYSPHRNEDRIRDRRDHVLERMGALGFITEQDCRQAKHEPVEVRNYHPEGNQAPYFVDYLVDELEKNYSLDILTSEGLMIFTSLDVEMQRMADKSVAQGLAKLEQQYPSLQQPAKETPGLPIQGCLVALEPQTGFIRAMVGGRDYRSTQFNRVTQARRQPGSLFKPITYAAAFGRKQDQSSSRFTATTLLPDEPLTIRYERKSWSPRNYGDKYFGQVTLRTALEKSLNCATAWLGEQTGYEEILLTARALGLTGPLEALPSIVLGSFEAAPLELASAYGAFANYGVLNEPRGIKSVLDQNGNVLQRKPMNLKRAVSPEVAFLITHLLEGVIERGTASAAVGQIRTPVAGKTGTTDDYRDAWFVGYTSNLLALSWVGFDQPRDTGLTGATGALPVWVGFMKQATGILPAEDFFPPQGVEIRKIDRVSGYLATSACPDVIEEAFLAGTEPTRICPLHPEAALEGNTGQPEQKGFFRNILNLFKRNEEGSGQRPGTP